MTSALFRRLCARFLRPARPREPSPGLRNAFARNTDFGAGNCHCCCASTRAVVPRYGERVKTPPIRVTLVDGHGPGPAVCAAVRAVLKATAAPVEWDRQPVSVHRDPTTGRPIVNAELLESVAETRVILHGPVPDTASDGSQVSTTLTLHKALRASVGVQPFASVDGHRPFGHVRMVNVRDNVSGEYSENEHLVTPGVVQSIKTVTRQHSEAVARFAFEYAVANGHYHVTALHKANVMRMSDGTFLKACRSVSTDYPDVDYREEKLDKFCLRVTNDPCRYDMLLTPSLYGAIASAAVSALVGGPATVPYMAFGSDVAVFGTMYDGPAICRKDVISEPVINPTGIIRSAAWMLGHLEMPDKRLLIETALNETIRQGVKTRDMGGTACCEEYTDAIVHNISRLS
ncbi:Isopropylmalate dehydrogenase-like domain [Cinara cedri]|uniref:isocitrate dehydrogenase (NAD(+)) n=1 Tax=Cinara cedri TaxID=506608 RepID=A0A5E4NM99_9HEMI|nr:Isopropylmalate dehydrogenase-like domain [Cinara cedri]